MDVILNFCKKILKFFIHCTFYVKKSMFSNKSCNRCNMQTDSLKIFRLTVCLEHGNTNSDLKQRCSISALKLIAL